MKTIKAPNTNSKIPRNQKKKRQITHTHLKVSSETFLSY
jgi:hypothetical protein